MNTEQLITAYLSSLTDQKRMDLQELNDFILGIIPNGKLWFFDGKDENGKIVTNPQIGYGHYTIKYADGKTKAFYQVGLSANTSGVSVYIMGIDDKTYLPAAYEKIIGKASVTGYCIKFKQLKNVNKDVLKSAIKYGIETSDQK